MIEPITTLSLSPDCTQVALSPSSNIILIMDVNQGQLSGAKHTLREHSQLITGIDWGKRSNRILSCSQDRTAFIWTSTRDNNAGNEQWYPTHVLLDSIVKRGLTCCTWNSTEDRAIIGSAANNIAIGKDDKANPFWVCLVIQPHDTSVTTVVTHPTHPKLFASASIDGTVHILKITRNSPVISTLKVSAWVLNAAWSPCGRILAFSTQSSDIYVCYSASTDTDIEVYLSSLLPYRIAHTGLPLRALCFLNKHILIAGGYDNYPVAISTMTYEEIKSGEAENTGNDWKVVGYFDEQSTKKKILSATELARHKFVNESLFGQSANIARVNTRHLNAITTILPTFSNSFLTSGLDGKIEHWSLSDLNTKVQ